MAEPIGIASGLLTLAAFAFQSSVTLYETIKTFNSHQTRVRDLLDEIQALIEVLGPLNETIKNTAGAGLSALDLPLKRCGEACKYFEQEILKCLARSAGNRTSFRDWARLRYMSDDIDGFRRLLAGYKMTINIALTDASLRQSTATAEILTSHKLLIETAKDDLQARLESIDEKVQLQLNQTMTDSSLDSSELNLMKEERLSTEKCLQICASLSDHIDQLLLNPKRGSNLSGPLDPDDSPESITNGGLQECKESLVATSAKLEGHMRKLMHRIIEKSESSMASSDDLVDLSRLQDEWETTRQCIDICSKADTHLQVTTVDNYATGDSVQFMVSANGQVFHGKNRGLGWKNRQVGGHMSDDSIQQLSRDMTSANFRSTANQDMLPEGNPTPNVGGENKTAEYSERYGRGFILTPQPPPGDSVAPTNSPQR